MRGAGIDVRKRWGLIEEIERTTRQPGGGHHRRREKRKTAQEQRHKNGIVITSINNAHPQFGVLRYYYSIHGGELNSS